MEESWKRNRGGGIMTRESWRMDHVGVIIEDAARRRQPGRGNQEEAGRKHKERPRRRQEAPRRPPGGTSRHPRGTQEAAKRQPDLYLCLCLYLYQFCYFYWVSLKARGACAQQGSRLRHPR